MKASSLLWLGLASSCALPEFGTVTSFDDGAGGSSVHPTGGANTAGGQTAGSQTAGGKSSAAGAGATAAQAGTSGGSAGKGVGGMDGGSSQVGGSALTDGGAPPELSCTTAPLLAACDNECVDTTSDERHCSACNKPCSGAGECWNSVCRICPTGCAVLTANTAALGDVAWFQLPVNGGGSAHANLTVRVYALAAQQVSLEVSVVDNNGAFFHTSLNLTNRVGWIDFTTEIIPTQATDLAKTKQIELGLKSLKAGAANPSKVYVDSVSVAGGAFPPFNFIGSYGPLVYLADGSAGPSTVTGSLAWQYDNQ